LLVHRFVKEEEMSRAKSKELVFTEHGIMWPDYWQGCGEGVTLFVYPSKDTTKKDLLHLIAVEIDVCFEEMLQKFEMSENELNKELDAIYEILEQRIKGHEEDRIYENEEAFYAEPDEETPATIYTITLDK
jgi:hypothetical protein